MSRPIHRHALPLAVERGADQALTLDLRDGEGVVVGVSAASLVVRNGSAILDTFTADVDADGVASVTLAAADSEGWPLTSDLLCEWSATVDGVVYRYRITGDVVRTAYQPTITADDVFDLYPALRAAIAAAYVATLITSTSGEIERRLRSRGQRPYLILDRWAVHDAHLDLLIARVMDAADQSGSDDRWRRAAEKHAAAYEKAWGALNFRYDLPETGDPVTAEPAAAAPPIILTAGRVGGFWR